MRRAVRRGARGGAAIVTTLRSPGPTLESFVRYHLAIGFERIYLFFDDDPSETDAERISWPEVRVVRADLALWERMRRHPYCANLLPLAGDRSGPVKSPEELMTRQLCNAAIALEMALEEGRSWLLHIDSDELFFPGDGRVGAHFDRLDRLGIGGVIYANHEAVGEKVEHADCFRQMTLFKRNPWVVAQELLDATDAYWGRRGGYFLAYVNGKAAVRVVEGAAPAGVHNFALPRTGLGRCMLSVPAILHYPYTSFERYWRKFERLGTYAGGIFMGKPWTPPPFELSSCEVVGTGSRDAARKHYIRAAVMRDRRKIKRLIECGILTRIEIPAQILAEC